MMPSESSSQHGPFPQRRSSNQPPIFPSPNRRLPSRNLNPEAPPFIPQNLPLPQFVMPAVPLVPPDPRGRRFSTNPQPNAQPIRLNHGRRRVRMIREHTPSTTPIIIDQAGEQLLRQIADEQHARSRRFTHNVGRPPKDERLQNPIEEYEHTLAALRHKEELKILDEALLLHSESHPLWPNPRREKLLVNMKLWLERFNYEKMHLAYLRDKLEKRRIQLETDRSHLSSITSMLKSLSLDLSL